MERENITALILRGQEDGGGSVWRQTRGEARARCRESFNAGHISHEYNLKSRLLWLYTFLAHNMGITVTILMYLARKVTEFGKKNGAS